MPNLIEELKKYVNNETPPPWYKTAHNHFINDNLQNCNDLKMFLSATMDQVRLRHMNDYARKILKITDMDDFYYFSFEVLRKEFLGDVSYENHRDHSAHTLYNYLLGWYIFEHNELIRNYFEKHCLLRFTDEIDSCYYLFFELWPFVSLMHDIGYLFEGSLNSIDINAASGPITKGSDYINNYFKDHFWIGIDFPETNEREQIMRMSNTSEPQLDSRSLDQWTNSLRFLDNIEILTKQINIEINKFSALSITSLPDDSFAIWKSQYIYFRNSLMADRIDLVEKSFNFLLKEGMGPNRIRLIDHAVCGGLLLLRASTFYFNMYFSLKNYIPANNHEAYLLNKFISRPEQEYKALHWWQGIVWATAAVALHNIQQNNIAGIDALPALGIGDDPLTYLGILVDILQIWDRASVKRKKALSGDLPVQGIDIDLSIKDNKIELDYKDHNISSIVRKDLNFALKGWNDVVDIKP